jgi:hypothetical protein
LVEQLQSASFDWHLPLLSVPRALGTRLETIPSPRRYLSAPRALAHKWQSQLGERSRLSRIGLVWSGRPSHNKDFERSMTLNTLRPLFGYSAEWVSLQKEVRPGDRPDLEATPIIRRLGEELDDFADTAGLIENLDLVICVDTAVAHLAGALGKPVWILLPFVPDWRWLLERHDSPWYPSATLFRQAESGRWETVVEEVRQALAAGRHRESKSPSATLH